MKKLYVLDTNILLSNKMAPLSFDEHTVIVPLVVLEELDAQKMRNNDLSRDARAAIRTLEDIIGDTDGDLQNGILISESSVHNCHSDARLIVSTIAQAPCSDDIPNDCPDNIIINTALYFQRKYINDDDVSVVLVSNDINLRLKAKGGGMKYAQALKSDIVIDDLDLLPAGTASTTPEWLETVSENEHTEQKSCGGIIIPITHFDQVSPEVGNWLYCEEDNWAAEITLVDGSETIPMVHMTFKHITTMMKRRCSGVTAKSIQQAIAIDAILDRSKDVVVITGAAGSGKTLIALAAATEMILGKKNYQVNEIIFGKTMDSQFQDMGFLPGNEHEKLAPWAGAVYDNMEAIARISNNEALYPKHSIDDEDSFIKLKSLGFMRGRSLNHRVLIIDEAQNLNAKQMKTLLSRAGENCKVIIMGNLAQIDNDYVSENSSGLTYICQKFNSWERASIVHLDGIERSPLAEFVESNF